MDVRIKSFTFLTQLEAHRALAQIFASASYILLSSFRILLKVLKTIVYTRLYSFG